MTIALDRRHLLAGAGALTVVVALPGARAQATIATKASRLALKRWLPQDRRLLWILTPVMAVLAASSAIGIQNVVHFLRFKS